MINVHVSGETWADIQAKLRGLLPEAPVSGLQVAGPVDMSAFAPKVPEQPDDAEAKLLAAGASPEFAAAQVAPPTQKKRGPKPKSAANPPSQPIAPSVAQTDTAVTAAPPSDGAGQPAAEAQSGTPSPAASADLSFDEFKKHLNDLQATAPENLNHVVAALAEYGYAKVKDVKPEHYAGVLAKAQELVG